MDPKGTQTEKEAEAAVEPVYGKRTRVPTVSPQEKKEKKLAKKLSTRIVGAGTPTTKRDEWRAKHPSRPSLKKEIPTVLVQSAEGQAYAEVLKDL